LHLNKEPQVQQPTGQLDGLAFLASSSSIKNGISIIEVVYLLCSEEEGDIFWVASNAS